VTATNNAPAIPLWPTSAASALLPDSAPLTAQAPISAASALAISPGGSELAVGDSGTVYVAPVLARGAAHPSPLQLTGNGSINPDTLRLSGDSAHLLSASGADVAIWNLDQFDRLAHATVTRLPSPCDGCIGALTAISPNGRRLAAVADNGNAAMIQGLDGGTPQLITGYGLGPPLWIGAELPVIETSPPAPGTKPPPLPAGVRLLPLLNVRPLVDPSTGSATVVTAGVIDGGREVAVVDDHGNVYVLNARSGRLTYEIRGPKDLSLTTAVPLFTGEAAVDRTTALVARDDNNTVRLIDPLSRRSLGTAAGGNLAPVNNPVSLGGVAFTGSRLLVEREDGTLEIWNARGTVRERVIGGDPSYAPFPPIADPTGELVARQRTDGTTVLDDITSGATLATLPAPDATDLGLRIGLAFTPGGRSLVTVVQTVSAATPFIIQRPLDVPTLIRTACQAAGQSLSAAQWRSFVGTSPPSNLACH
jgi:hypothetical protein